MVCRPANARRVRSRFRPAKGRYDSGCRPTGLAYVNPALLQRNPHPPPVAIESVLIDGQPVIRNRLRPDWNEPVVVRARQERLEIHYTSLNLAAPERASFRYRMIGHESDWVPAGDDRVARYSKLPPAEYRFQVTAANEDGVWNETGTELTIVVQPPFWRTWWFQGGAAILLLCGIVGGVYYLSTQRLHRQVERLRQEQALDNERARIARDLHDQLGASLTQVSLLGELAKATRICRTRWKRTHGRSPRPRGKPRARWTRSSGP